MKDRNPKSRQSQDADNEQRQHARYDAAALPNLSAFIGRGQVVRLIDISKRGALVESPARLGPGRAASLRFVTPDGEVTLSGCVVRSSVSALSPTGVVYRTALSFAQDNPLCVHLEGNAPLADAPALPVDRSSQKEPILNLVTAVHQSGNELTAMLGASGR